MNFQKCPVISNHFQPFIESHLWPLLSHIKAIYSITFSIQPSTTSCILFSNFSERKKLLTKWGSPDCPKVQDNYSHQRSQKIAKDRQSLSKIAKVLVTFQFWWHFSLGDISVLMKCQFSNIHALMTFQSKICLRYVQDMCQVYLKYFQDMFQMWSRYDPDMSQIYLKYILNIF